MLIYNCQLNKIKHTDLQTHTNINILEKESENSIMNYGVMAFLTGNLGFNTKAIFFIKIYMYASPEVFYKKVN